MAIDVEVAQVGAEHPEGLPFLRLQGGPCGARSGQGTALGNGTEDRPVEDVLNRLRVPKAAVEALDGTGRPQAARHETHTRSTRR